MEFDDPLRKLLETTGWSCDDLLAKLQKMKSSQGRSGEPSTEKSPTEISPQEITQSDKCEVDSTEDIVKKDSPSRKKGPAIETRVEEIKTPEFSHTNEEADVLVSNSNIIDAAIEDTFNKGSPSKKKGPVIGGKKGVGETSEFSDTDEEEAEVLVTNSNIIDEIIEDISTENSKSPSIGKPTSQPNENVNYSNSEVLEVTEVKIIEINTDDDDDDKFEDECHGADRLTPEKMEELEKLSRELNCSDEAIDETASVAESVFNDPEIRELVPLVSTTLNSSYDKNRNEDLIGNSRCDNGTVVLKQSNLCAVKEIGCKITTYGNSEENLMTVEKTSQNTINEKTVETLENGETVTSTTDSTEISNSSIKITEITGGDEANIFKDIVPSGSCDKIENPSNCNVQIEEKKDQVPNEESNNVTDKLSTSIESTSDPVNPSESSDSSDITPSTSAIGLSPRKSEIELPQPTFTTKSNLKPQMTPLIETVNEELPEGRIRESIPTLSAVNNMSSEDANRSDNFEKDLINEKTSLFEDIRNNLKMQLSCLRTKKKGNFLGNLNSKSIIDEQSKEPLSISSCSNVIPGKIKIRSLEFLLQPVNDSQESKKSETVVSNCAPEKTNDNNVKNDVEPKESQEQTLVMETSANDIENTIRKNSIEDDNLYTQTNELGFVIMDVQGGIDIDRIEQNESTLKNVSTSEFIENSEKNPIVVFDEIRKIIRKQKSNNASQDTLKKSPKTISNKTIYKSLSCEDKTDRNSSVPSSADNSQSSFNFEDSHQNTENNSPFVSNSLDEFLTENAKLNISYNVPKCGAEEGLKESYEEDQVVVKKSVKTDENSDEYPKKTEQIKPKTLAQKRKLLERQRQCEMKKRQRLERKEHIIKNERKSFVMFEKQKLMVKTFSESDKCVAVIDSLNKPKNSQNSCAGKRKLSLLAETKRASIKYLPGPLSKKPLLQITGTNDWETVTKNLPKLFIEVAPCIGKPLPPNVVRRIPTNNGVLTSELIEFALSVVKTKNTENASMEKVIFPVKYKNDQEQVVVRRRKQRPRKPAPPIFTDKSKEPIDYSEEAVKDVIEGLLNYVEIKEISSTLIKEDEDVIRVKDTELESKSPVLDEKISVIKKPPKKKSRIDLELQRLSCKVVNVELEEKEETMCTKPFCKLGCVCKSLKCDYKLNNHCQLVQCMFDCSCPKEKPVVHEHKMTLPANTDLLSNETVNRIEDEAKRNLAKVEREFTQTVIQTNDKTIVVGVGSRHKTRRNTKIPIKYSDFVNENYPLEKSPDTNVSKVNILRQCEVHLPKLNLSELVPFCMTHNLHDCHCKGQTVFIRNSELVDLIDEIQKKSGKSAANKSISRRLTYQKTLSGSSPETITGIRGSPSASKKPKLDENDDNDPEYMTCARAGGIDPSYKKNRKVTPSLFRKDFAHNINEADMLRYRLFSRDNILNAAEADILKWTIIKDGFNSKKNNRKRKQIIEVRDEEPASKYAGIEGAMQRRKKVVTAVKTRPLQIRPIFDGEVVMDDSNMELLARMGPRHVADGYVRLVPWKKLVEGFHNGTINVWCMKDQSSKLMMNKAEFTNSPKNYIDIRQTTDKTMIILCILGNKLPPGYDNDNVSFILRETKDNFEICGLCSKNINPSTPRIPFVSQLAEDKPTVDDPSVDNPTVDSSTVDNSTVDTPTVESMENNLVYRDIRGVQRILFLKKEKFKLQELIEEDLKDVGDNSVEGNAQYMWAALPEIYRVCKWRVIYLNSDFAYLVFKKINCSIKYKDLMYAGSVARDCGHTVMSRNAEMQNQYDHKLFGIYFDPHYLDRLFVGPYFKQYSESDIETLRYINGKLVATESFNRMRGDEEYKCGHWLIERPYKQGTSMTIDLTDDQEDDAAINNNVSTFLHNNTEVKILDTSPKTPAEFNRYVITNIPHFGYLGAFQHPNSEIDIQWPFEKKLLRFRDTKNAIDFLQKRLSTLLVSIPETFKIAVLLLTSIDFQNTHPIEASVLGGYHICGEFGAYNISELTDLNCMEKTGFPKDKIISSFIQKRQYIIKLRAQELATLVGIPENTNCSLQVVVNKAWDKIKTLNETNKRLVNTKSELILQKKAKAAVVFEMISHLPAEQKFIESKKLMSIVNSTEPIEIVDSDEENEPNVAKVTEVPANRPSTSSNSSQRPLHPMVNPPPPSYFAQRGKSLLKKRPSELPTSSSNCGRIIQGVKIVQSSSGKLVLVSEKNSALQKSPLSPGMKVTIKNNKIQSIRRMVPDSTPESASVQTKENETEDPLAVDTSPPVIDLCDDPLAD